MDGAIDFFAGLIVLLIVAGIYLMPTIVAICRREYYSAAAIIINICFGWTFIGWVLALILAFLNAPREYAPQQIVVTQVVGSKNSAKKITKPKTSKTKKQ